MAQAYYRFRRNQTWRQPAALLQKIHSTLKRHGYDYDAVVGKDVEDEPDAKLAPDLMARVLGPGRLGIAHRKPPPAEIDDVLPRWSKHAGVNVGQVRNLLAAFASDRRGKIRVAGAPKCGDCEVHFCKRLQYR